jgi:hypothetical protein
MTSAAEPAFPKGVGAPATRALNAAGYTELSQLAGVPAAELRKLHGMGPKALRVIQAALEEQRSSVSDSAGRRTEEEAGATVESVLSAEDPPSSSREEILADLDRDRLGTTR